MIGRIAGRLVYKAEDHVLVDVRGVGYLVFCSDRTLRSLPQVGEATAFFTELLVREDLLQLFGFATLAEKEWHRLLMSVQGIGAKASLAILGALGPDGVSRAIALGDWSAIRAAKGIGPKTAQRVVNELKEKAPVVMAMGGQAASRDAQGFADDASKLPPVAETPAAFKTSAPSGASASAPAGVGAQAVQAEALSALANLGYAPGEAASAVAHAMDSAPPSDTAALIRAALKRLAPTG